MLVAPDRREVVPRDDVRMDHPTEQARIEPATHGIARCFRGNGTLRTENGFAVPLFRPPGRLTVFRQTPIHMLVPPGDAEWHPVVEARQAGAFRRGVHGANQYQRAV